MNLPERRPETAAVAIPQKTPAATASVPHAGDADNGAENGADEDLLQVCTFMLGECLFGVDILQVQEISSPPPVTQLYHAHEHVAGVVNIRGQIVLCLDLRRVFGLPPSETTPETRLILFKKNVAADFGIMVDCVGDILDISARCVEQRHADASIAPGAVHADMASSAAVKGVCMLQQQLVLLIDAAELLRQMGQPA